VGVRVEFNYVDWIADFPQFVGVDQATAARYFRRAELWCRNDGGGPITDCNVKRQLMGLLTAHIAQLSAPQVNGVASTTGQGATPAPNIVGRIASASEGSVSVSADFPTNPNAAFFNQTEFGAEYWAATSAYRTMRYIPGFTRAFTPFWPG
jgi:hypothetical protein